MNHTLSTEPTTSYSKAAPPPTQDEIESFYSREELTAEERRYALEQRMLNLVWTISGDYSFKPKLDLDTYEKTKWIAVYDAIKQGGFAKYFSPDELGLYLLKKQYYHAEKTELMRIAQLCLDCAVIRKLEAERGGVSEIRCRSYDEQLDRDFKKMSESFIGQVKILLMSEAIREQEYMLKSKNAKRIEDLAGQGKSNESNGSNGSDGSGMMPRVQKRYEKAIHQLHALYDAQTTRDVLAGIDLLYNTFVDPTFTEKYGDLDFVLALSNEELTEFGWKDFLSEDLDEEALKRYMDMMSKEAASSDSDESKKNDDKGKKTQEKRQTKAYIVDASALEKVRSYIELNYGKTYLTEIEEKQKDALLCRGAHHDCHMYYTDGILSGMVKRNYQSEYARRAKSQNLSVYRKVERMVHSNIKDLSAALKRSLQAKDERDFLVQDNGDIIPERMWKIGRVDDNRLFRKELKKNSADFAVHILIDSSGSQRSRQALVAIQGYMLSEALTDNGIPHMVTGFCTFWNYTVMRRFRDYDEKREANKRIFEFHSSANNRDGLAIRAAVDSLQQRQEENKVLIVLSDGRPNDQIVQRTDGADPTLYTGEFAVYDTAYEVRKARNLGISVLGVFAGEEQDLRSEQKIYGRDFAYIRDISHFAHIVSKYLQKQIDEL